ncbi:pilus assembly protein CpaF [Agromyces flavus]|uniref:Pilus assembly protein CpaF n=1 Tax=Agromyces flavus TaxID=589382 RepID=A0A1H1P8U7_9MICO|nr:ATPase, T2SS/T4P/T4SS family [Agromyces flavus]MCP2367971.1 pilus assembly protein CpaF [Agromyces flavus]GGI47433.1 pilus assembly protein CpaF [Agromyces flavus]SDS07617.1 pilus assembly protein CpaF [Agromyces flavus]
MSDPVRTIAERVRGRVLREGVDLARDDALAARYAVEEVRRYSERALAGAHAPLGDEPGTTREVVASITGYGPLQPFFDDPTVEEIWINSPTRVFVARAGVPELTTLVLSDREVRDLVERMLQHSGRRVDLSSPFVDASLPDGSRLHVAIPDVTRSHWAVNVRKFQQRIRSLGQLVDLGSMSRQASEFLRMSVLAGANILVSGATHTGKTTMLNALMSSARTSDRVVTVEETFELDLDVRDLVSMQCRQPNLEGTGEITLRRLIKEALRMRPDRLVVGEVREAESLDLLIALNSGVPGMCTIHANSARDALAKLCTLPLLAGRNIDSAFVVPTVASCIDIVVHLAIDRDGHRRVVEIAAPTGEVVGGAVTVDRLFGFDRGELAATGSHPARLEKFNAAGLDPAIVLGAAA